MAKSTRVSASQRTVHAVGRDAQGRFVSTRTRTGTRRKRKMGENSAPRAADQRSGRQFLESPPLTVEELAARQGVKPITDLEALRADFWPEEESVDEFIATVRAWREGRTVPDGANGQSPS
jgi:hypothetical protein